MTSRHPPVEDWATDFDHTDSVWAADPYLDLGRPARALPRRAQRPVRRDMAAGDARAGFRGGLRHRALHLPFGRGQRGAAGTGRPARPHRAVPADHLGPALPRHGPRDAAARLRAPGDRRRSSPTPGSCAASSSPRPRAVRSSTRPPSTPGTSRSGSSSGSSASPPRTPTASGGSSAWSSRTSTRPPGTRSGRRCSPSSTPTWTARSTTISPGPGTTSPRSSSTRRSAAPS